MKYEVRCECGKAHSMSAADAGASVRCACERTVDVPPLHMLRASAGQQAISPVIQIRGMLLQNQLPGTRACACCHRDTDELVRVSVECERVITKSGATKAEYIGCVFLLPFVGWLIALLVFLGMWTRPDKQFGDDVSVIVPLPLCPVCDHDLKRPGDLREALCAVPVYEALLERYPNALVARVS